MISFEMSCQAKLLINPLHHMSILDSSNSAANIDMMSKILTNGGSNFVIE